MFSIYSSAHKYLNKQIFKGLVLKTKKKIKQIFILSTKHTSSDDLWL